MSAFKKVREMRKSNSIFKTAFVSEAGAELANNDYFAYVEDNDFACYVLAEGITDFETSVAAKEVVEHLILSFEEKPGMSKSTLLNYMEETNQRLLSGSHGHRLKASVIMLVTDYEKFRYVAAGNVRLRMYRQGRFFLKSSDMSLANDLIKKGEIETPLDIIEIYLDMSQFMLLGDHLFQNGEYDQAEAIYLRVIQKAATLNDNKTRDKITDALEKIYDKRAKLRRDAEQKLNNKKQTAMSDAMKKGDTLLAAGDLDGAQKAYRDARNLSDNIADRTQTSAALDKVSEARTKKEFEKRTSEEERKKRFDSAIATETKGDEFFESGDYLAAQMYYLGAIEQYIALSENVKVKSH